MAVAVQISVLLTIMSSLPYLTYASLATSPVTMTTTLGHVTGVRKSVGNNKKVDVFYGIPFAQPPVDDLRFRPPVPAESWQGVLDATKKPHSCWQAIDTAFDRFPGVEMWNPNTPMSEDCLYLNVWSPVCTQNCTRSKQKPILVWIFGGGFTAGTATLGVYDASQFAAINDVVVVSIAYRIGPLGFLYLGNEDAPGNAGLLDQTLALQWVKDNAAFLGGSSDDITLFGESAGAVSVGFHLLSPLSRDLFTYGIMQSASPIAQWAIQTSEEAKRRAFKLVESLSCPGNHNDDIVGCLRSTHPKNITDNQWTLTNKYFDMTMGPVVDGHFLPDQPIKMLVRGDIKTTSVILGVNSDEGIYFDVYAFQKDFPLDGTGELNEEQYDSILRSILENDSQMVDQVKEVYSRQPENSYTDIVDAISGDTLFKCPVVDFAQLYSQFGGTAYVYSFEHRVSTNPWPEWFGVAHGYEIEIVFGLPLAPDSVYTEEEKELSLEVMKLWTQFASIGNPNPEGTELWPEYRTDGENYIILDTQGLRVSQKLRHDECAFWNATGTGTNQQDTESKRTAVDVKDIDGNWLADDSKLISYYPTTGNDYRIVLSMLLNSKDGMLIQVAIQGKDEH